MASGSDVLDKLDARECAALFKTDSVEHQLPQTRERIELLRAWLAPEGQYSGYDLHGKHVLELGCGQGDCTTVLGQAMQLAGGQGRLYGVDPGRPDYGSPYTLSQAQEFISKGPLSDTVSFAFSTGPDFLKTRSPSDAPIDALVMAHCLYYLPSVETLDEIFESCRQAKVSTLLLAEWSLTASKLESVPHMLAVLLQSIQPDEEGNIRTVFTPQAIIASAQAHGYELVQQKTLASPEQMQDGRWEVAAARSIAKDVLGQRDAGMKQRDEALRTHLEALNASVTGTVECMDVWTGVLKLAN